MSHYASLSDDYYINHEPEHGNGSAAVAGDGPALLRANPEAVSRPCGISTAGNAGEFVLEEDKEQGKYRWATVEPRRVCSGYVNPETPQEAFAARA